MVHVVFLSFWILSFYAQFFTDFFCDFVLIFSVTSQVTFSGFTSSV